MNGTPSPLTKYVLARWRWVLFPLGLWIATRLSYLLLGYLSLKLTPGLRGSSSQSLHAYPALDALCCWDCGWFDKLARLGYGSPTETNVWPGLPVASRWLSKLTGMPTGFAILTIANLACLGAYLTLYRLFARLSCLGTARIALALYAAYPFAYYHASGYPEAIMVFASALAVSFAISGRHVLAGTALGIGILSRHLTVLLGGGLLIAQLRQHGLRGFFKSPAVLALALPFLIAGIYLFWCHQTFGDALSFWRARSEWSRTAWWGVADAIRNIKTRPHIASFIPFALFPTLGTIGLLRNRKYAELAGAALPLVASLWIIGAFALGRFSASCWPAFLPLGAWFQRHPRWQMPVLILFGLAQGWYFFLTSHHYEIQ